MTAREVPGVRALAETEGMKEAEDDGVTVGVTDAELPKDFVGVGVLLADRDGEGVAAVGASMLSVQPSLMVVGALTEKGDDSQLSTIMYFGINQLGRVYELMKLATKEMSGR